MPLQINVTTEDTEIANGGALSSFFASGLAGKSYFKSLFDGDDKSAKIPRKKPTARQTSPAEALPAAIPITDSDEAMAQASRFLTHTIVGAPHSILLGGRISFDLDSTTGLVIHMKTGLMGFSDTWSDSWVLSHALDRPGKPRNYPSQLRSYLERRALVIAAFGIAIAIASVIANLYLK